jgi:LAS superfamily LD-carboxypeptidase LdcB
MLNTIFYSAVTLYALATMGTSSLLQSSLSSQTAQAVSSISQSSGQQETTANPATTDQPPVKNPCPQPTKAYPDYSYLDVGQDVAIPDPSYVPPDLTLLDKSISTSNICLRSEAAAAVTTMIQDAKEQGYDIKVSSGFRSYDTQEGILSRDIASGNPNATKLVAKPGYSEHQLGMAVDLTSSAIADASAAVKFGSTKEFTWLQSNAYKYGFIQSYPAGKEEITGYMNEAWHYRYVGIANALAIVQSGETTNQYLKGQQEQTTETQKNQ